MNKKNLNPSIKKNYLYSMFYEILSVIVPFITAPYIARVLGAANTGIYSYTYANVMYFSLIAGLGTAQYGKREIARTRDDSKIYSRLFWEIEILSILTSILALIGWGIFILLTKEYKLYYCILTFFILSTMFDISWFYKGLEQFKYTVTKNTIVRLLGVICLFLFVKTPDDLWIYFLFHAGIDFLGSLSMWISLPKFLSKVSLKNISLIHHFKETLVYFIPTIATSIYTILDKTLIGIITKQPEQNGYYEQATKIIKITKTFCFTSLNAIMGSRVSYLFEKKQFEEIKNKISKSVNFILFMSIGSCLGLIAVANDFIPFFYGPGYDDVIPILILLSPILIITGISTCLNDMYFTPFGLKRKSAIYIIIGAFVNFICNILFIPHFKSIGAVIGTLVAEMTILCLYIYNCNKYLLFSTIIKAVWKKIIAAILMYISIIQINHLIINKMLALMVEILFGIFIYIFVLFLLKDEIIKMILSKFLRKK